MAKTLKPGESATHTQSPWHLQGSQLVAIDCETTGLDPNLHEIYQIAIVALDYNYLPRKDVRPLNLSMRIENPDTINYNELGQIGVSREKLQLHITHGTDQMTGLDAFIEWTEKLELPPNRRLCPLAQNWPHDRQFLINWMGLTMFNDHFHPHYRDLIPAFQLINDLMYTKGNDVLYKQVNLSALCRLFEIEVVAKHNALSDAVATAEVYRRVLNKFARSFVI